jgi:ABC-2 type transport system permease protein
MTEANAILAISYRDLLKFMRDPTRIVATLVFPAIFIAVLGSSFDSNLSNVGYSFLVFTFTGVFAQTLFQSASLGIISLVEDRENDFSQEMFVSPISRYSIVFGKIAGESLVAITQGVAVILIGMLVGVPMFTEQVVGLLLVSVINCLYGGAFGLLILSRLKSQRAANQVFPFIMLPQFFLAGVFTPIQVLPWYLDILSKLSPLRYAVDLTRGVFYAGMPEYDAVVLQSPAYNLVIITITFFIFLVAGTFVFVREERNR